MNTPIESKSQARVLTSTSYAILGVLALRPHSTYELAKQTGLSLHYLWPRAESNIYAEPKRLVEAGLAESREEWTGSRKRTVYSITEAGLETLRAWIGTPSAPPRFESEAALKTFFGEHGSVEELLANIESLEREAREALEHLQAIADTYADGQGQYPERFAISAVVARLLIEQQLGVARWASWAKEVVSSWDTTQAPAPAQWGVDAIRSTGEAV